MQQIRFDLPAAAHLERVSATRKECRVRMVVGKYSLDVVMSSCILMFYEGRYRGCYDELLSYMFQLIVKLGYDIWYCHTRCVMLLGL